MHSLFYLRQKARHYKFFLPAFHGLRDSMEHTAMVASMGDSQDEESDFPMAPLQTPSFLHTAQELCKRKLNIKGMLIELCQGRRQISGEVLPETELVRLWGQYIRMSYESAVPGKYDLLKAIIFFIGPFFFRCLL
jgi:hypothetical protein